jgi:gliding motility-associated-like protein
VQQIKASAVVNNDFEDQQEIIITVTGGGSGYQYQLNNGQFQESNVFTVTEGGEYFINVTDNFGCYSSQLNVYILKYPKFFTPNNDGFNDTWNINVLTNAQKAAIYIFDRYGKLLKQISPTGPGWNGTYNGHELPSTDYWFKLLYQDSQGIEKQFQAHFSLKR